GKLYSSSQFTASSRVSKLRCLPLSNPKPDSRNHFPLVEYDSSSSWVRTATSWSDFQTRNPGSPPLTVPIRTSLREKPGAIPDLSIRPTPSDSKWIGKYDSFNRLLL